MSDVATFPKLRIYFDDYNVFISDITNTQSFGK